jgi:hypothetical protein
MSLPPPGGNGLNRHNTPLSHETGASVVSAAIKCQAEVAGASTCFQRQTEAALCPICRGHRRC